MTSNLSVFKNSNFEIETLGNTVVSKYKLRNNALEGMGVPCRTVTSTKAMDDESESLRFMEVV